MVECGKRCVKSVDWKVLAIVLCISEVLLYSHISSKPCLLPPISLSSHASCDCTYLSLLPLRFLSTPLNPATPISTRTCASPSLPPPPPVLFCSDGPDTVQITFVLPISRYDEPSADACVEICAVRRRSSFQRRPSRRRSASAYEDVSSGMIGDDARDISWLGGEFVFVRHRISLKFWSR